MSVNELILKVDYALNEIDHKHHSTAWQKKNIQKADLMNRVDQFKSFFFPNPIVCFHLTTEVLHMFT